MADYSTRDLKSYRTVSDLRTQYVCEYRLFLKKQVGDRPTEAAARGSQLHADVEVTPTAGIRPSLPVLLFILMLTLIAAIMWILG